MAHNVAREPGTRPGTFFYHIENGYYFHESEQRHGTIYFKCVRAARGCRGRASYDPTEGFVLTGDHNHAADPHYADEMALRHRILQRCESLEYVSFQRIILDESEGCVNNEVHASWVSVCINLLIKYFVCCSKQFSPRCGISGDICSHEDPNEERSSAEVSSPTTESP